MVKEIQSLAEIPKKGAVVLDFYADWCGPCRRIAPTFEKLEEAFPSVVFLKVNVDMSAEIVEFYDINVMPTFVFLKDSGIVKTVEGADMKGLEHGFQILSQ
jgi:thioredoxin 1